MADGSANGSAARPAPRLSLVTLGVRDIARSRTFYERMGFRPLDGTNENVVFLSAGGTMIALFGRSALAEDARLMDRPTGFAAVSLAENMPSGPDVDRRLDEAVAAGATLLKPAEDVFWGGYSGYYADPDGHVWEIAYNPFWPLDAGGAVTLAELQSPVS
ncbi:MAG: VOC family protein [Hyphomicrobium sp.]|nr:VOC family protein [Hyphomicrobium sp.]